MSNTEQDGFFNSEENRILDKTMQLREDILDSMTADGIPEKTNEIRVIKEVIESMDKKVMDSANLRAKVNKDKSDTKMSELVIQTLKNRAKYRHDTVPAERILELEESYIPDDVVEGEMEMGPAELDANDYIYKEE